MESLKTLKVILEATVAGTLRQDSSGALSFAYDSGYNGTPLSVSMPNDGRVFNDKTVRPYLEGLLPESQNTRRELADRYDVMSRWLRNVLTH